MGVAELLEAFDEVRAAHEAMPADAFNDDGTYKGGINTVRHVGINLSAVTCKCEHRPQRHLPGGARACWALSSSWRRG